MDSSAAREPQLLHDIGRRRAWAIWAAALSAYVLAIFHRSSLGVAGLLAADRFDISASQLAAFTVLQLLVYAGLQIPVGVLLDRFGSKRMILAGLALMTAGQLAFAFTDTFAAALAARAVIGAGDAMIFGSVLRLVAVWFLVRQAPMVAQLTGQLGQVGAIVAATPLSVALHALGWTKAFAGFSVAGLVVIVAVALLVKDSPYDEPGREATKLRALARSLRVIWSHPTTRLGMWSHFTSQFGATVFSLLWGFPFLVSGEGLSRGTASGLLMLMTGWIVLAGPVIGRAVTRHPFRRSQIVLGVVAASAVAWAVVLLWPGQAPLWLLVVLVCVIATGGPASMVGFELARTLAPVQAVGRANGLVNIGGFTASLLTMWLIGAVLDLRSPAGPSAYDLGDFRVALSVQYAVWLLGSVQIVRYRRRAIAHMHRHHPDELDAMRGGTPAVHLGFTER
ncbi:MFS transporter [Nocardioides phosphati]|uniref:MFS transporter n=1 Tax=Nocardioides phosphati TaxID=1867775 RepID=A0ABQ2NFV4_9ACTN|nr:MFS transporter [Nocardioides phosphati]GGO90265.1 MFS transporter [Nocardioides phosphati]